MNSCCCCYPVPRLALALHSLSQVSRCQHAPRSAPCYLLSAAAAEIIDLIQINLQVTTPKNNRSSGSQAEPVTFWHRVNFPPPLVLHHAARNQAFVERHSDTAGLCIPGRLKSQHPQIPQQGKTIIQLPVDWIEMIKATYSHNAVI